MVGTDGANDGFLVLTINERAFVPFLIGNKSIIFDSPDTDSHFCVDVAIAGVGGNQSDPSIQGHFIFGPCKVVTSMNAIEAWRRENDIRYFTNGSRATAKINVLTAFLNYCHFHICRCSAIIFFADSNPVSRKIGAAVGLGEVYSK